MAPQPFERPVDPKPYKGGRIEDVDLSLARGRSRPLERPVDSKPYKGAESYQGEDGDFFYGRDREAEELVSSILSARLSVLHAPSGAGKSSLLNARVIPTLEARGWRPIRVVPQNDPIASVVAGAFQQLLPPPSIEGAAIRRMLEARPDLMDGKLSDALTYYDALPRNDKWRRRLIAPFQIHAGPKFGSEEEKLGWSLPFVCRLLRRSISVERLDEHFRALLGAVGEAPAWNPITIDTPCRSLLQMLEQPRAAAAYNIWCREWDIPVYGLVPFFENVFKTWGQLHNEYAIIVIIDQFEEMFTRFVDRGQIAAKDSADAPDWRLKNALFDEIRGLHAAKAGPETKGPLPIRVALSLRNEYLAELDPIRRFVGNLGECSYHLGFLRKVEAAAVIREPARTYGYDYEDQCFDTIVADLVREDRFIEPTHVQVVCEKLWQVSGSDLVQILGPQHSPDVLPKVPFELFSKRFGGTRGILRAYFGDVLGEFTSDDQDQILDMLEPLITAQGTRNIVAEHQLVKVPFQDEELHQKLLTALQDRRIVRIEGRLGGRFAEVTHEFLIQPILDEIGKRLIANEDMRDFRWARRALEQIAAIPTEAPYGILARAHFNSLHRHHKKIDWTYEDNLGVEIMLRNAIVHSAERSVISEWVIRAKAVVTEASRHPRPDEAGQS